MITEIALVNVRIGTIEIYYNDREYDNGPILNSYRKVFRDPDGAGVKSIKSLTSDMEEF